MGEQKTLLVLVNFYDNPTQQITFEQGQAWFKKLDDYIREASHGKAWLTGQVAGWYTIDQSASVCNSMDLSYAANRMMLQDNITPSSFDRVIYAFPKNGCSYAGSGQVGGSRTTAFINNQFGKTGTLFHEYGHNLGLAHAMSYECDLVTLGGSNCNRIIYGDSLDVMGDSRTGYATYNPHNRMVLGWFNQDQVLEVTQDTTINLIPYTDNSTSGVKALRIPKPGHPGHWFTIESRQSIGQDEKMLSSYDLKSANILNGVIIRETTSGASYLLDATPDSSWSGYSDWRDPALTVGNYFQDPYSGIRITPLCLQQWEQRFRLNLLVNKAVARKEFT